MIGEAIVGGALGAGLRMLPEMLKLLDGQLDRKHELKMQAAHLEYVKVVGAAPVDPGPMPTPDELDALRDAYVERATATAPRWIKNLAAAVRPGVTFLLVLAYVALLVSQRQYTIDDMQLLSSVLGFWFLGRVWERPSR